MWMVWKSILIPPALAVLVFHGCQGGRGGASGAQATICVLCAIAGLRTMGGRAPPVETLMGFFPMAAARGAGGMRSVQHVGAGGLQCVGTVGEQGGAVHGVEIVGLAAEVAGDVHAALFGHGVRSPGAVKATYGTGSSLMTLTNGPMSSRHGLSTTIAWRLAGQT